MKVAGTDVESPRNERKQRWMVRSGYNAKSTGRPQKRIAVIGVPGSGKTTMAVGLFATSSEDFTVGASDDTTRAYLERLKSDLQDGRWPSGTLESERPTLNLFINRGKGRVTPLSFEDYKGERVLVDPNFTHEIIGNPDGAILLFNPGMSVLSDTSLRNSMMSIYCKIIDYLKESGCRHVVFAVTAADRIDPEKGDLKDSIDTIRDYEKHITNYLQTVGGSNWWKRIPVTVTGILESQQVPVLATGGGNTASGPFRYLIERFSSERSRRNLRKVFLRLGLCAFLFGIAAAGFSFYSFREEARWLTSSEEEKEAFIPEAGDDVGRARENMRDLDNRLTEIKKREPFFSKNRIRWNEIIGAWTCELEEREYGFISSRIENLLEVSKTEKDVLTEMSGIGRDVDSFDPVKNPGLKTSLTNRWDKVRPVVVENMDNLKATDFDARASGSTNFYDCVDLFLDIAEWKPSGDNGEKKKHLMDEVDEKIRRLVRAEEKAFETGYLKKGSEENVERFDAKLRAWNRVTIKCQSESEAMLKRLPDKYVKWCTEYMIHEMSGLKKNLSDEDLISCLEGSKSISMTNGCTAACYDYNRRLLEDARKSLLEHSVRRYSERCWPAESGGKTPDKWVAAEKGMWDQGGQILRRLTDSEKSHVAERLREAREKAEDDWHKNMAEIAKNLVDKMKKEPRASMVFTEYRSFCLEFPANPGLTESNGIVRLEFIKRMEKEIHEYYEGYEKDFRLKGRIYETAENINTDRVKKAKERFSEFSDLCIDIYKESNPVFTESLKDSRLLAFCEDVGGEFNKKEVKQVGGNDMYKAFRRTLKFVSIDFKMSEIDGAPTNYIKGTFMPELGWRRFSDGAVTEYTAVVGSGAEIEFNAWEEISFYFKAKAECEGMVWGTNPIQTYGKGHLCDQDRFEEKYETGNVCEIVLPQEGVELKEYEDYECNLRCNLEIRIKYKISGEGFRDVFLRHYPDVGQRRRD